MEGTLKNIIQFGLPGVVIWLICKNISAAFWHFWLPLPVLVFWLTLRMGVIPPWFPALVDLRKQIMGVSPEGLPIHASIGAANEIKLRQWSDFRKSHQIRSANALSWLGRLYHPEPFHPLAMERALIWALGYTLIFWLIPYLFGSSGYLGDSALLPDELPTEGRWMGLIPIFTGIQFILRKRQWGKSVWRVDPAFSFLLGFLFLISLVLIAPGGTSDRKVVGTFSVAFGIMGLAFITSEGVGAVVFGSACMLGGFVALAFANLSAENLRTLALHIFILCTVTLTIVKGQEFISFWLRAQAEKSMNPKSLKDKIKWALILHFSTLPILFLGMSAPLWFSHGNSIDSNWSNVTRGSFELIFFFGILPWLNALADYFSVGITQYLMARYRPDGAKNLILLADVLSALALTLTLYVSAIGALHAMRVMGWQGLEPHALTTAFVSGLSLNKDSPAFWLTFMALTNIIPTLAHLCWALWAWFMNLLSPDSELMENWVRELKEKPKGEGLGTIDAQRLARYLLLDHWVSVAVVISFIPSVVWVFIWIIPKMVACIY